MSNAAGNTIATNSYDEYGIPATTNIGRFQYTGQAWLAELGMSYYKARIYSPTLGRFLQTDPIGYGDGMNWYNYVGSDPVNGRDPTGLMDDPDDIVVRGRRFKIEAISQTPSVLRIADSGSGGTSTGGIAGRGGAGAAPQNVNASTPGQETPDTEDENAKDIAKCNSLSDPGARSRCFQSANARDSARRWNRPVPPLITWRTIGPTSPSRLPSPWLVGGVVVGGAAVICVIVEPCGAAAVGILGLTGAGLLATQ